ncbi:hypothetical protein Tco_0332982 [Tanacetum coccineum]
MKELYDKVQESIKDSFKDFSSMDSGDEKLQMLKESDEKRLLRKRKATISEEQPSKKFKLRTETVDELRIITLGLALDTYGRYCISWIDGFYITYIELFKTYFELFLQRFRLDTCARTTEDGDILKTNSKSSRRLDHEFLQNILDLYFKHFKLSEDVVNRILQVVLDLQHFKSSLFIFAATILQSSSAIHHISNIDNYVHQIIKFQSILITSSHSLWSSQSFGHQKGVCPWLTENHFNSQYLKHWASQSFGT